MVSLHRDTPAFSDLFRTGAHFLACLLLAVATLVVFGELAVQPGNLLVGVQNGGRNDVTDQYIAFRNLPRHVLEDEGTLPLWNPFTLSGAPWLSNPQSALLYPPNWLFLVLESAGLIGWLMVVHHWWAGVGAYFLARRYDLRLPGALVAGTAFLAAPFLIAQTGEGHYNQICLVAWIPWAFLAWERFRAQRRGGTTLLAGVFALCFFCGHAQEVFYLVLILTVFTGLEALRRGFSDNWKAGVRPLARWAGVGLATIGLVAVELLPIWIYTRQAVRSSGLTAEEATRISVSSVSLWQLLDPFALGGPADYRGPGDFYWETVCHFGIVAGLLAIPAVFGNWSRYPVKRFAALWLVGMVFAFGADTPLFPGLHAFLPGISFFRAPSRALFFCSFATAILAGVGIDGVLARLRNSDGGNRKRLCFGWGTVFALAAGGLLVDSLSANGPGTLISGLKPATAEAGHVPGTLDLRHVLVWTAVTSGILGAALLVPRRAALISGALFVACTWELSQFADRVLATMPASAIREKNPVVAHLEDAPQEERVLVNQDFLSDREAWSHRIRKVQGYDPVPLARYGLYMAAMVAPARDPALEMAGFQPVDVSVYRKPLLDLLGVRWAVMAGNSSSKLKGWNTVSSGHMPPECSLPGNAAEPRPFTLYANPSPMPRAFVLGNVRELDAGRDMVEQLAGLNPREEVLLERDVLPPGDRQPFRPAQIVESTANSMTVEASLSAPGYLVLAETWYPGWDASVDGRDVRVLPANLALRAVPLEAGGHTVTMRFRPPLALPGLLISLVTLGILCLAPFRPDADEAEEEQA